MPNKPSDIPSIRKVLDQLAQLSTAKAALPILGPLLSLAGVDTVAMRASLQSVEDLHERARVLAHTLDRFNELMAPRGWIAYDLLNADVAKAVVRVAETGDIKGAEGLLVQHYGADQVAFELGTLQGIQAFRPRLRLAELALADYREGRYHASIPVVLALLDGMVNELGNQGFFSQTVDLVAWDSIAAHDRGLTELKRLLFKQRSRTTTDTIDLPYRNGILHGMDLAYDTPTVAAKCWAALFATADWARRVEQGQKEPPRPEPEPTWKDVIANVRQVAAMNTRLESWRPRPAVSIAIPDPESPEATVVDFLEAWKARNYGVMAKWLGAFDGRPLNTRAGQIRRYYEHLVLREFAVENVTDKAAAVSEISVRGKGSQFGQEFDGMGIVRMVHMDAKKQPVVRGGGDGTWFVMNWNPWQVLCSPAGDEDRV